MAEPFTVFTSRVVPIPAENVDTDQIVPARYLKVTDKDGLAEALFRDWRFEEDGSLKDPPFVLDQPGDGRAEDPARRRQLRGRVVTRARPVGADRVGRPGHPFDLVRRHLPQQQPQERRAADRGRRRDATRACSRSSPTDPDAQLTIDLAEQGVLLPDGTTLDFDIDPFAKRMILAGTDELGYLLSKDAELSAWEAAHPPRIDSLAGAR